MFRQGHDSQQESGQPYEKTTYHDRRFRQIRSYFEVPSAREVNALQKALYSYSSLRRLPAEVSTHVPVFPLCVEFITSQLNMTALGS